MGLKVTVEVPLFLTFFGFLLTSSVDTNLLIYRTCYVILSYDKYNCSLLGKAAPSNSTIALEKIVQPKADVISMTKTIVDSGAAAVLCLFIGSWSDRFGRKPVLLINLIGFTLMYWVMVLFAAMESASPWFMLMSSVPVILTGGGASLLIVLLAYLADVTSKEERGFRLGVFEVTMGAAILLGGTSSSYLLSATNYVATYAVAALSCFLALIYTIFVLPESLEVTDNSNRFKGFFQLRNISGLFRTGFKQRPHYNRAIILLLLLALALFFVIAAGDGSVIFLYTRAKFSWSLKDFTLYNTATSVTWIFSTLFVVYVVHYRLEVKESILIFIGLISLIIGCMVQGLAQVGWLMYLGYAIKIPNGGLSPLARSLLSKLVEVDEAGKIFSLFSLIHYILGSIASPIYTTLYNATIQSNPGIFNFLTSGILSIAVVLLFTILTLENKTVQSGYISLGSESGTSRIDPRNVLVDA